MSEPVLSNLATGTQVIGAMVVALSPFVVPRLQTRLKRASEQQGVATGSLEALNMRTADLLERLSLYVEHCPGQIDCIREALTAGLSKLTPTLWYSPFDRGEPNIHVGSHQHILDVEQARLRLCERVVPLLKMLLDSTSIQPLSRVVLNLQNCRASILLRKVFQLRSRKLRTRRPRPLSSCKS